MRFYFIRKIRVLPTALIANNGYIPVLIVGDSKVKIYPEFCLADGHHVYYFGGQLHLCYTYM